MESDLEPIVLIVARRTGHPVDVVRDVVQSGWGLLQARKEWDASDALERGIRIGIHTMDAVQTALGTAPEGDGPQ